MTSWQYDMPYIAWQRWEITGIKHWFPEEETSIHIYTQWQCWHGSVCKHMWLFSYRVIHTSLDNSIKSFHWLGHYGIWSVMHVAYSANLYLYFMLVFYMGPYINGQPLIKPLGTGQIDSLGGWINLPGFKASGGKFFL